MDKKISLRDMLEYAQEGLEQAGYRWQLSQGRKRVWTLQKDGKAVKATVRTTQDRWFAFPRKGEGWKTLDEVGADAVVVAAVDDRHRPRNVEVYVFPAEAVRRRFNAQFQAHLEAGHAIATVHNGNFGMWVALDRQPSGSPSRVGSGLADEFPPVAVVPILDSDRLGDAERQAPPERPSGPSAPRAPTIADVLDDARRKIAEISGRPVERVSLDLRIG